MNEKSSSSKNVFFLNPNYYKKIGSFFLGMVNGRKDFLHSLGALGLSFVCLASPSFALDPNALPTGYQSAAGNVQFSQSGNTLNLSTQSQKSIVNYQTFNIGQNATVNMNLPSSNAAILNRVNGGFSSEIFGQLNSNGRVFLINPNGIIFGSSAQVNVGSLFASTLQMSDDDFLAGNYVFKQQGPAASIINRGKINASQGGAIALLGGSIENSGSLNAQGGQVLLGVGKQISLNIDKNIGVDITVDQALEDKAQNLKNAISNTGSIQGNFVKAQAEFTNALYDRAINNEGIIEAAGLVNNNGVIELVSKTGIVENSGKVLANSEVGNGGNIKIIGEETYLLNGSQIEANGKTGGGEILIGGDFQGKNPEIQNSKNVFLDENTSINANALESGNGGKIIVWADEKAIVNGEINAKGVDEGGFIETSGKYFAMGENTQINTSAISGKYGNWLLDPLNITISDAGTDTPSLGTLSDILDYNNYTISPTYLNSLNSNIILYARENITNDSNFALTSGRSLTAVASNDIIFNNGSGLTTTNGNISLVASGDINLNNANLTANNGEVFLISGVQVPFPYSIIIPSAPAGGTISGSGTLTGTSLRLGSLTGGDINLTNTANDFTNFTAYLSQGGNVNYTDANNINLVNYTVTDTYLAAWTSVVGLPSTFGNTATNGTLNISTVNGTINAGANINATNINLNAGGTGNITQTAGTISATNLSLTTQSGNATKSGVAGNANNTISTNITNLQATTNSGTIRISDVDGVNILASNLNADGTIPLGSLTVRANGAGSINQTGAITGANNLSFTTASGNINLGNFDNNTNSLNISSNSGNATFKDTSGFTLNSANLDANNNGTVGNLTLIAGGTGDIAQTNGTLKANELTVVSNTGNINLIGNNNDVNKIQITTNGGNATYTDINGFEVKGANLNADGIGTNGNLTLTAKGAGNITQTAGSTMQGGQLTLNTQSGSANITNADFTNLSANSTSGSITYFDADGININSSNLGSGNLTINSSRTGLTANNGAAETDLTLNGNISAADVSLKTDSTDNITQIGGTIEGNTLTLNSAGGIVEIGVAGKSDFAVLTGDLQTSDLTYTDTDGLLVSNLSGINANITTNKNTIAENLNGDPFGAEASLNLNNDILIDTLSLNALGNGQQISQLGGQAIGNDLSLSSNGGQIQIGQLGDADFNNIQGSTKGGNATYIDTDGVNVQNFNVGKGNLQITTAKDTTFVDLNGGGETDLNLAGNINGQTISLEAKSGDITQTAGAAQGTNLNLITADGSANINNADFTNLTANSTSGSITYSDRDGININSSNIGTGNLTVNSSVTGITANNAIVETNLTLNGDILAADVNLNAGGTDNITQASGTVQGANSVANTQGGNININNADFYSVDLNSNNGSASYSDKDGFANKIPAGQVPEVLL